MDSIELRQSDISAAFPSIGRKRETPLNKTNKKPKARGDDQDENSDDDDDRDDTI